jgi:hypothetical protein
MRTKSRAGRPRQPDHALVLGQKSLTLKNQKAYWSLLSIKRTLEIETPECASGPKATLAAARGKRLDARWLILANSISYGQPLGGKRWEGEIN